MTNHESDSPPPQIPDAALEAALRGHRTTGEHPGLDRVADAMNTLRRPGAAAEEHGHDLAMAAYQRRFSRRRPAVAGPRRVVLVSSAAGLKLLATAGGSAVALGAVATVLFATSLGPGADPQTLPVGAGSATTAKGKPSATSDSEDGQGKGPDATGPAASGLCRAWSNHLAHGTADEKAASSPAFRNLAAAAGGQAKVTQYCATVGHPGQGKGHGNGQGNGQGKPDKGAKPTKTAKPEKSPKPSSTATPTKPAKPTLSTPARPSLPSATSTAVPTSTATTTATTTSTTTSTP